MSTELAEAFPVGEFLAEELEARSWTQTEFAEILGRPTQFVSEIIAGKKEITRESAAQIAAAFGGSPTKWLKLQDSYHLWRQQQDPTRRSGLEDVELRAKLNERAPMSVLRKRGIITARSPQDQCSQLLQLLGTHSLEEEPWFGEAARRSNSKEKLSPTQVAWLACVRQKARELEPGAFEPERLEQLGRRLSQIVSTPAGFRDLPAQFAEVGVRLVYVEAFPSSKIDGASLPGDDGSPIIGLSGRWLRLDKVLFTLLHEIAHIVLGHLAQGVPIIDENGDEESPQEEDANKQAAGWALPAGLPDRVPGQVSQAWVNAVAREQGVHPMTVVGRLQKIGKVGWRTALVSNAPNATDHLRSW